MVGVFHIRTTMQKLEAFLPRIMIWVDGCPQPLAEQALVDSAIKFCEDTDIVQVTLDVLDLVEDVQQYDLDLPRDTELARVTSILYGDDPFAPIGAPNRYQWTTPATITIWPKPTKTQEAYMNVVVSTRPTRTARTLDDTLLSKWVEAVCGGAVARIASMQGQPFTNAPNAQLGSDQYMSGVNRAKYELRKNHTTQDLRVVPRAFARGRRFP